MSSRWSSEPWSADVDGGGPTSAHLPVDGPQALWRAHTAWLGRRHRSLRALEMARAADRLVADWRDLSGEQLAARRGVLATAFRRQRATEADLTAAMALVREVCRRELGLTPYVEQLAGGFALLSRNAVEMDTGEGKTLTTAIPAAIRALGGRAVHVVTANDYLARRDGELLRPVFNALGLEVGIVTEGLSAELRRKAYAAGITFVSNKEVAFDYLRDRLVATPGELGNKIQRKVGKALAGAPDQLPFLVHGLDVAIVDEIDSVLVDDAGTPLIISAADQGLDPGVAREALTLAAAFDVPRDFVSESDSLTVTMTSHGQNRVDQFATGKTGAWRQRNAREELVREAISALRLIKRDHHYLVEDGKVIMIDQHSGRRTPDRYWGQNLQTMLEVKEGIVASGKRKSLASISYQRFFRSYRGLSGMSGTVREVAGEMARIYGLSFVTVPRRLPNLRITTCQPLSESRDQVWAAVSEATAVLSAAGRPVLIGVRSVVEAERGSAALAARHVPHAVLSAAQDADESSIVSGAGQHGKVTIATNMAGRGTDIKLGPGVAEQGGLVLVLCERHDSRRVDRQLMGRCARQGDPGMVLEFLSQEDGLLQHGGWIGSLVRHFRRMTPQASQLLFRLAQWRLERQAATGRLELVRRDERLHRVLAIAGGLD